jgi:hypothetical protein
MLRDQSSRKRLTKRAKKGFRGFPWRPSPSTGQTAAGPPSSWRASSWRGTRSRPNSGAGSPEGADIREDPGTAEEVLALIDRFGVRSVAMVDRIIGCPHEEGIDYEGPTCPHCPYWAGRDRWTGEVIQ